MTDRMADVLARRRDLTDELERILERPTAERRDLTEKEYERFEATREDLARVDEMLDLLERAEASEAGARARSAALAAGSPSTTRVRVGAEPNTYSEDPRGPLTTLAEISSDLLTEVPHL